VLVSAHFVPGSSHALGRVVAVEVFGDHLLERSRPVGTGAQLARIYADHAAVCATLELSA